MFERVLPKGAKTGIPKKGDICATVVDLVSLPPRGNVGIPIRQVSVRAGAYLEDFENLMRHPDGAERVASSAVRSFTDPVLRSRKASLRLVARMYLSGMITMVKERRGTVDLFTVVKKLQVFEDGSLLPLD